MNWFRLFPFVIMAILIGGCSTTPSSITRPISVDHTVEDFLYCGGYGCDKPHRIRLSEVQWAKVQVIFNETPRDADEERARIAEAIGLLEAMAGNQAGTLNDRGGTLPWLFAAGQLDCFSEASNTSNFLGLLARDELLRFQEVNEPRMRGLPFTTSGFYNHATAVIEESETGDQYVVDSWFFDNGEPAVIVPLEDWLNGWSHDGGAWL